jgi:hypothetical protein
VCALVGGVLSPRKAKDYRAHTAARAVVEEPAACAKTPVLASIRWPSQFVGSSCFNQAGGSNDESGIQIKKELMISAIAVLFLKLKSNLPQKPFQIPGS